MAVALVTGASRGIGQATALELARQGFDVALAARTLEDGEGRDDGDFNPGRSIEGSLRATARAVSAFGVKALPLKMDLLNPADVDSCVETVVGELGRLDVLVNNATLHRGANLRMGELTRDAVEDFIRANFAGPLLLSVQALSVMVAQGGGRIINVASAAGLNDPPAPPGEGGWGVLYGGVKAGQLRFAGSIKAEYPGTGVLCFTLNPGFVKTPVIKEFPFFSEANNNVAPSLPGQVIAWLATSDKAEQFNAHYVDAPTFAREHADLLAAQ